MVMKIKIVSNQQDHISNHYVSGFAFSYCERDDYTNRHRPSPYKEEDKNEQNRNRIGK